MMIFIIPFYYPLFYLQLDALKHGLSASFSFYAVRISSVSQPSSEIYLCYADL